MDGLYLIVSTERALELVPQALAGGIDCIQLRHKGPLTRAVVALAEELLQLCGAVPLIVNDRVDLARAVGAAGVHLGQTDLPLAEARALLGPHAILGATASTLEEALRAEAEGASYVGFGHIFPTSTKVKSTPPVGLAALREVCRRLHIPVVAIGGIHRDNIAAVWATGVAAVAVASAIGDALDPCAETRRLKCSAI